MDNLVQYIQQTLSQGGCVSVAQAGVFTLERVSSYVEDGKLHPPCTQLVFTANPSLKSTSIPQIWYVEPALMKDEMMAAQQSLAHSLQQFVGMQDRFQIPGWGVFVKEAGSARYILQTSTGADDPISFPVLMESIGVVTQQQQQQQPVAPDADQAVQSMMEKVVQPAAQVPPAVRPEAVFQTPSQPVAPQPSAAYAVPQPVAPRPDPQPIPIYPDPVEDEPQPVAPLPAVPELPPLPQVQPPQPVPVPQPETPRTDQPVAPNGPSSASAAGTEELQGHIYQPAREYTSGTHHHHKHHQKRNKMIVLVRRLILLFLVLGIAAWCMHRYISHHPELQVLKESAILPDPGADSTKPSSQPVRNDSLGKTSEAQSGPADSAVKSVTNDSSSVLTPEEALGLVPSPVPAAVQPAPADSVAAPSAAAAPQTEAPAAQPAVSQPEPPAATPAAAAAPAAAEPAPAPKKTGIDYTVRLPEPSHYYVVVASLPSAEQAQAHMRSLARQGAATMSIYKFGESTFRVVAGACATQAEARTVLDEVKNYSPSAWVFQYR